MSTTHSQRLARALRLSQAAAHRQGHPHVKPEQLLLGLLALGEGSALRMLKQVGVTPAMLHVSLEPTPLHRGHPEAESHPLSREVEELLYIAHREACYWGAEQVETQHLLLALLRDETGPASRLLNPHDVHYQLLFDMAAYDRVGLPHLPASARPRG